MVGQVKYGCGGGCRTLPGLNSTLKVLLRCVYRSRVLLTQYSPLSPGRAPLSVWSPGAAGLPPRLLLKATEQVGIPACTGSLSPLMA